MASAQHIKALLQSHVDGDDDRFFSVAMQIAAHEAGLGHGKLALELRAMIDAAKAARTPALSGSLRTKCGDLSNLLHSTFSKYRLGDLLLNDLLADQIKRVVHEHRNIRRLLEHGLSPRRKLLLIGPPGTGKTFTASVLAGELGVPLLQVQLHGLLTTSEEGKVDTLGQVFQTTAKLRGVYSFDRLDVICSHQGLVNHVEGQCHVLDSFLMMLDQDNSHSIIVVATDQRTRVDDALFSHFDDVLQYALPSKSQIAELLKGRLRSAADVQTPWGELAHLASGLSHAAVSRAANDVLKASIIGGHSQVRHTDVRFALMQRKTIAGKAKTHTR